VRSHVAPVCCQDVEGIFHSEKGNRKPPCLVFPGQWVHYLQNIRVKRGIKGMLEANVLNKARPRAQAPVVPARPSPLDKMNISEDTKH